MEDATRGAHDAPGFVTRRRLGEVHLGRAGDRRARGRLGSGPRVALRLPGDRRAAGRSRAGRRRVAGVPASGRRDGANRVRPAARQRREAARPDRRRKGGPFAPDVGPRAGGRPCPGRGHSAAGALATEGSLVARLVRDGHARIPPARRGIELTPDVTCVGAGGRPSRGLAAIGRPTEDWVIGNDTLNRALHPHAEIWARRVVARAVAA